MGIQVLVEPANPLTIITVAIFLKALYIGLGIWLGLTLYTITCWMTRKLTNGRS